MKVSRAHRFELKPNNVQRTLFARCAGTARFAWNWALAERQRLYREKEGMERFTNANVTAAATRPQRGELRRFSVPSLIRAP